MRLESQSVMPMTFVCAAPDSGDEKYLELRFGIDARGYVTALSASEVPTNFVSSSRPRGQSARPLAELMWPALPMFTKVLPQALAKKRARSMVTYSSFVLATTMLGKGSRFVGIGAQPVGPFG